MEKEIEKIFNLLHLETERNGFKYNLTKQTIEEIKRGLKMAFKRGQKMKKLEDD